MSRYDLPHPDLPCIVTNPSKIIRYNEDMHNCAYIKTWIGGQAPQKNYESAGKPRGGGWGFVRNITFSRFDVQGADGPPSITQDTGNNGSFAGTSKMEVSKITFENFSGYLSGRSKVTASVSCSQARPCFDIIFKNMKLRPKKDADGYGQARCKHSKPSGVKGLKGDGCS
jgi:hypothetical protein